MEEVGHVELFILYAYIIFINTFIIYIIMIKRWWDGGGGALRAGNGDQ